MKIIDFDFDSDLLQRFLDWPRQLYAGDSNWIPDPGAAHQLSGKAHPGAIWRNFLVLEDDTICGRVTAIVNPLLCDDAGRPYGQLGFFECIDDVAVAQSLVGAALAWLRENAAETQNVLAPINFDTWHGYRLRTKGFHEPTFFMEPYNPPYYSSLFDALGFAPAMTYVSKTVDNLATLMDAWRPFYFQALAQHYTFRSFNPADINAEMSLVYRLSVPTFRDNYFFADLPEAGFRALYADVARSVDPALLFFMLDAAGEAVGFSFSVPDHRDRQTVNLKTFGVMPQVRGVGMGAALAYEAYWRFQSKGYTRVNHCLMRSGNRADQFDRGLANISREYAIYVKGL
jgi:ribosomal protein S18 acetylase RimI-like enzyme